MDSDALILQACQEAVQEMYDVGSDDHEKEIVRLQNLVRSYYQDEQERYQDSEEDQDQ